MFNKDQVEIDSKIYYSQKYHNKIINTILVFSAIILLISLIVGYNIGIPYSIAEKNKALDNFKELEYYKMQSIEKQKEMDIILENERNKLKK